MAARKKSFRTFSIENTDYIFSVDSFRKLFNKYKHNSLKESGTKITAENLRDMIAKKINVSSETVKKWYSGSNGPTDIEVIKDIATFFDIDYMELLSRKEQEKMIKDMDYSSDTEKDVIDAVYQKIVDIIMLEAYRYKESVYGTAYVENEDFYRQDEKLRNEAYEIIDRNGLVISNTTRRKLYNILAELKTSLWGMEDQAGRWIRLNPLYYEARELLRDGECFFEESEKQLRHDIEEGYERPYRTKYVLKHSGKECNVYEEGYHKYTEKSKVVADINSIDINENKVKDEDIELEPYDDERYPQLYSNDDIYKYEFLKIIIMVFKEDFPEYYQD